MSETPETVKELRAAVVKLNSHEVLDRVFTSVSSAVNTDRVQREATTLHVGRPSRTLFKRQLTVAHLWDAQAKDIEARSRLVELRVSLTTHREVLSRCVKVVRTDVSTQYASALRKFGSTSSDRSAIVDRLVRKPLELVDSIDSTLEVLDTLIKDIDQTAFGLRNAADLLKITLGPRASEATI